jgi:hypothetical protein
MKPKTTTTDPAVRPKGSLKAVGGSENDAWNNRLANSVLKTLPDKRDKTEDRKKAENAAVGVLVDMNPSDPIEGILIAQLIAAHEAAHEMYSWAWHHEPYSFEVRTKYLSLADKAARTVAVLTERLDHHRGRGQQKIIVQHVTTNNVTADRAVITDSVVTGNAAHNAAPSTALLTASAETPMPTLDEASQPRLVGVGGGEEKE